MAHVCHARGCGAEVPPKLLMCRKHWRMVPKAQQAAVWATYRPGQERRKDPSRAYLAAANAAIDAVAAAEAARAPKQSDLFGRGGRDGQG